MSRVSVTIHTSPHQRLLPGTRGSLCAYSIDHLIASFCLRPSIHLEEENTLDA